MSDKEERSMVQWRAKFGVLHVERPRGKYSRELFLRKTLCCVLNRMGPSGVAVQVLEDKDERLGTSRGFINLFDNIN